MPAVLRWPLLMLGSLFIFSVAVTTVLLLDPSMGEQVSSFLSKSLVTAGGIPGFAALSTLRSSGSNAQSPAARSVRCLAGQTNGYQRCSYTAASGDTTQFLLHVPSSYDQRKKYPLVLVLHGGGERAKAGSSTTEACDSLEKAPYVKAWVSDSVHKDVPSVQSRWPSFVVVPLLSGQNRWVNVPPSEGSHRLPGSPTPQLEAAKELVDTLRTEYSGVDGKRLYITGVSLGGYGTWDAIERWPGYFAAAVPVSGGGDPSRATELESLPIWVFHGASDHIVPVSGSRDMVEALRAAGGEPKYTEYAGAGHDIWARVYSVDQPLLTASVFQWLFSQHRSGPAANLAG